MSFFACSCPFWRIYLIENLFNRTKVKENQIQESGWRQYLFTSSLTESARSGIAIVILFVSTCTREKGNKVPSSSPGHHLSVSLHPFWVLDRHPSPLWPVEYWTCWALKALPTVLGLRIAELCWISPTVTLERICVQPPIKVLGLYLVNKSCSSH